MEQIKRQKLILEMVKVNGEVRTKELAEKFDVSLMTIRRDLKELEKTGEILLVHGGAVYKENSLVEHPMSVKELEYVNQKRLIGQYGSRIMKPGSSVFMETGTATLAAAKEIFHKKDCTFYTNSLLVLNSLSKYEEINLYAVPGKYRDLSKGFIGVQTIDYIRNLNFDYCLIGTEGISVEAGVTLIDENDAGTKKAIMKQSKCKILLTHSGKFGKVFLHKIGEVSDFDFIITDDHINKKIYNQINKMTNIIAVSEEHV